MLLEEGAAFSTDRHRGILLADGTFDSLGDRSGDRVNARSGEDDGGFGRAGGLGGFKLGDLGVSLGESDFQFLNFLGVSSGLDLEGFKFSGHVNDRGFDRLAEVVAFSGKGDDSGLGGLEAFFDGHILLRGG